VTIDLAEQEFEAQAPDEEAEVTREDEAAAKRPRHTRLTLGLSFLTLGLCLLLFVAYVFTFTGLQEQRKQRQMLNVFTTAEGAVTLTGALPKDGGPAAVLTIPSLHLRQVVVQGTTPSDLTGGPGTMTNAARLGTKGNAVILGRHFTGGTPFATLDKLKKGATIVVITSLGKFTYTVTTPLTTVANGEKDPASPTEAPGLTLITASSITGGREYVRASLSSEPAAAKKPTVKPSPAELGVAGQPGQLLPTIIWGLLLAVALGLSFSAYRRWRSHIVVVYVLSTPIVLGVALVFYSHFYLLLPSTI